MWTFRYQYIDEIPGERWKHWDGKLHVSDHGRVKKQVRGGYVLCTYGLKKRYIVIGTGKKHKDLHLVVMELFGDLLERRLIDPLCEVDHIDSDPRNNHIRNLQILSKQDHSTKTNGLSVILRNKSSNHIEEFKTLSEAAKYLGVNPHTMSRYANGTSHHPEYQVTFAQNRSKRVKLDK
jgi:hypothetical protein